MTYATFHHITLPPHLAFLVLALSLVFDSFIKEGSQFLPRLDLWCGAALSPPPDYIPNPLVFRRLCCAATQLSEGPLAGWQSGWCS